MGIFDWLRREAGKPKGSAAANADAAVAPQQASGSPEVAELWEPVAAYLPVDAAEHHVAVAVASAIAAGDREQSKMVVKRVSKANPEYQRVAVIASALAAGALEASAYTVKHIYKQEVTEENHAA
ncbi:hypothetical protein [Enorma phocaeensis]|uniref:Uncharacterized protein n=1 Tax=Enorma phocaeensis TaxID=1871019 RepID=A0A921IVR7_9ACTN|nr:hypothetical protein [Enorma phocaeensis]HJG36975.1 hypothetical protein [Enorma phocaeensis]